MALDSAKIFPIGGGGALERNASSRRDARNSSAINGLFQQLENLPSYIPGRFRPAEVDKSIFRARLRALCSISRHRVY